VGKLANVMQQASEEGCLLIPSLCVGDVAGNASDPGAVRPDAGARISAGFVLKGGFLVDQCLTNFLQHVRQNGCECFREWRLALPHFTLFEIATIVPHGVDVREGAVNPMDQTVFCEPLSVQAASPAPWYDHFNF
jgi:hypothetical protein